MPRKNYKMKCGHAWVPKGNCRKCGYEPKRRVKRVPCILHGVFVKACARCVALNAAPHQPLEIKRYGADMENVQKVEAAADEVPHNHLVWPNEPPQPFCMGCDAEAAKKASGAPPSVPEVKNEKILLVLGSRLGSGANKYAYELKEDPTKVALVSSFKVLDEEIKDLKVLSEAGIPVPKVYELYAEFTANKNVGRHESVALVERFACGSRGDIKSRLCDVLNDKTLECAKEIREKLLASRLYVGDIQFLFREDGTMVVADPEKVVKAQTKSEMREMRASLDLVIKKIERGVEYVKDRKEGIAPPPEDVDSYAFWSAADKWHENSVEPKAARKAAQEGVFTQTRELVFEEYDADLVA